MAAVKKEKAAIFQMLLCAVMWSLGGIFIKLVPWNSFVIAGWRSLIAGSVIFIYMRIKKVSFRVNKKSIASAIFLATMFFAFITANKLTTAANAIVLQYTSPIYVLFGGVLFFK